MQDQARDTMRASEEMARRAIDNIPPDAWPIIDLMMRILIGLALVWLVLALIGWWRRRAYNLTVASTASRNKKAKPGFLNVDEKARADAIARGEAHEDVLEDREREEALAALKAAAKPLNMASKIARLATLAMSIITLLTGFTGAIFNVGRMSDYIQELGTAGRIEYVVTQYPIQCAVAVFVIGYSIWRYFAEKKWEKD